MTGTESDLAVCTQCKGKKGRWLYGPDEPTFRPCDWCKGEGKVFVGTESEFDAQRAALDVLLKAGTSRKFTLDALQEFIASETRQSELSDSAKRLLAAYDDLSEQQPEWDNPVSMQLYALRGTIIRCTESLITAMQEGGASDAQEFPTCPYCKCSVTPPMGRVERDGAVWHVGCERVDLRAKAARIGRRWATARASIGEATEAERDALRAEVDRMRPVVEAAVRYEKCYEPDNDGGHDLVVPGEDAWAANDALESAVNAYIKETGNDTA